MSDMVNFWVDDYTIQVTSNNSREKIQYTIDKFIEKGLYNDYNDLKILILTNKKNYRGEFQTMGKFPFTIKKNILDYTDVLKSINHFETNKLEEIKLYLENELNKGDKFSIKYNFEWFKDKVEENIKNLGSRYSPEINVDLNVNNIMDALEQNNDFKTEIKNKFNKFIVRLNEFLHNDIPVPLIKNLINCMEDTINITNDLISFNNLKSELLELEEFMTRNESIFENELVKKDLKEAGTKLTSEMKKPEKFTTSKISPALIIFTIK